MKKADVIIVGQGLAGTVLALELLSEGKNILVIDKPGLSNCSKAAGGIYNPIVFKRLTQSWMAGAVLPAMLEFYEKWEKTFQTHLLFPIKLRHLIANEDEEKVWQKKAANELAEFIAPLTNEKEFTFSNKAEGIVKQAGYLDIPAFLQRSKEYLQGKNAYLEEKFDHSALKFEGEDLVYRDHTASRIIFCEGPLYKQNPWFSHLSFKPVKGEILTVHCEELHLSSILTKDLFVLPLQKKGYFKVGSTYNWDDLTDEITAAGRASIEEKLKKVIPYPYTVADQQAGVRPSTIDRRPVIGFHKEHRNLGIFNGFGTKAVMLAPFFAKHFCSFIENKSPLWQEVDVKRFA